MANYIAIDGGTTNTRVHLLKSGVVIDTVKIDMGVRINANGTDTYKAELKKAVFTILSDNSLSEKDIERVICSGMITSDLGLMTLPHLALPCGIEEMAKATENASFPEITSIPFVFVRGLKTDSTGFENADMMRGEEAELMGLCEKLEESRIKYSFITNCSGSLTYAGEGLGTPHLMAILESLGRATHTCTEPIQATFQRAINSSDSGRCHIIITPNETEQLRALMEQLAHRTQAANFLITAHKPEEE